MRFSARIPLKISRIDQGSCVLTDSIKTHPDLMPAPAPPVRTEILLSRDSGANAANYRKVCWKPAYFASALAKPFTMSVWVRLRLSGVTDMRPV